MQGSPLNDVTLAVLAGGAGSRMGRPKGLLEVDGRPVLSFVLERLAWPGPTLLVTAPGRQRPPGWEEFDKEVVDPVADEGPLRGMVTALERATTDVTVVVAVDMPGATRDDLAWLAGELAERPDAWIVMASRAGRIEPLPCAIHAGARNLVASRLASGRRSLHGLADDARVVVANADTRGGRAWLNANTPGEWERIVRELRDGTRGGGEKLNARTPRPPR